MPALLVVAFIVSGASSLVLQVVWVRKLVEVFGSSTLAISTVLATFMAGLAIGAWIGGRAADRMSSAKRAAPGAPLRARIHAAVRDPVFYYALAELTVGLAALAIPHLVEMYRGTNAWMWSHLNEHPAMLGMARFALCACVLLIPTTAMGATLPLLSRRVTQSEGDFNALGRRLAVLYSANTAGAVFGAGAAGFYLIPSFGVNATNWLAALAALTLAGAITLALLLPTKARGPSTDLSNAELPIEARPQPMEPLGVFDRRLVLFAYAVSGAVAMALEVFWSRALAVVIGSSVYSFTLVLVVFLIGISLGSAAIARSAERTRHPLRLLAYVFVLIAISLVATERLIDDLPILLIGLLEGSTLEVNTILSVHTLLAGLVILPAALGLGAVMPLAMRAYVGGLSDVGRDVGRAYAANTFGAIIGALAAGFLILPLVGLEGGVCAATVIYALLAAVLAWRVAGRQRVFVCVVAAVVVALVLLSPGWNHARFTAGLFRTHMAKSSIEVGSIREYDVRFYRDGISTTVSVEQRGSQWVLKNNGKVEASNRADMPTQILVGVLPLLLHEQDQLDVFVVGYGSGVTVGSIALSPQVSQVNVVELEPAIYEAADLFFSDFNHAPQNNPKVARFVGDARNFLIAGDKNYDIIVSEPSNPWIAGVASLFTRDFYQFAKEHLAPGGIFCQWAQLYELGPRHAKMIYRTFSESFPYVYAFTPGDQTTDTILIGAMQRVDLDFERLMRRMRQAPALIEELERAAIYKPEDILASIFLGPTELAAFTAGASINTDDNARLEYGAPRDLLASGRGNEFARSVHGEYWPYGHLAEIVEIGDGPKRAKRALAMTKGLVGYGRRREAASWLELARRDAGDAEEIDAMQQLFDLSAPVDFGDPELVVTADGPKLPVPNVSHFRTATPEQAQAAVNTLTDAYPLIADGRWDAAWKRLEDLPARADAPEGRDLSLLVGYVAYKAIALRAARDILHPLTAIDEFTDRRPAVLYYMGRTFYGLGAFRRGIRFFDKFRIGYPQLAKQVLRERLTPIQ